LNVWSNTIVFGLLWFLAVMITIRHHKNISNLADHKENKIGSKKNVPAKKTSKKPQKKSK